MRRWPAWAGAATLAFAAATAAGYFWTCSRLALFSALQLALLVLIATGSGRVLLRILGLSDISDSQKTLIGCTMGLGLLSLGTFLLAAGHRLTPAAAGLMLASLWLAGFTEMGPVLRSLAANRNILVDRPLAAGGIIAALALVFWTAWIPPHQYDSLVYHLPLAQAYVRARGFVPVPHLLYSHFPQNGEMLFTLALLMRSDLLAQLFMWLALALSAWWMFELGKRELPLSAVLLACLLLCTHTSLMLLGGTTYVESLAMLWTTAAALCFLRWRQLAAAADGQRSWLVLSGVFTGLALGTKYYAGITAGLFGTALAARAVMGWRRGRRTRLIDLATYVGVAGALFAPWLIKNLVEVGNPVFPFLYRWFPSTATGWDAQTAQRYFQVLTEYGHAEGFWKDLTALPGMLLTNSLSFGRGMDVLGGLGWELIFWSMPLAVWSGWRNGFLRAMIVFCAAYGVLWFSTGVVLRFLAPLAPLLCLLAGGGLHALWKASSRGGKAALGAGVGLLTVVHLLLFLFVQFGVFRGGDVLLGVLDRDQFLANRLDYYPCARFAEEHLGKNDRILVVGEQRGYYLAQDYAATTVHAPNRWIDWANEADGPESLARRLREAGFNDILFVPREFARLSLAETAFTEKGLKNLRDLEPAYLATAFKAQACLVSTLKPAS